MHFVVTYSIHCTFIHVSETGKSIYRYVFSINEPIYYEDLEILAIDVIDLKEETEDSQQYKIIK